MTKISLMLLGTPTIQLNGETKSIRSKRALGLLAYLVVSNEACTRESLTTLMWPDIDPTTGRAYLRHALWVLRKDIDADLIEARGDQISLGIRNRLEIDIWDFDERVHICSTHDHPMEGNCSTCAAHLAEATSLYRDDFLRGFTLGGSNEFDEWLFYTGERYRSRMLEALSELTAYHLQQRQWEAAISDARRAVAIDPLHEKAHQNLMKAYAYSDQIGSAIKQFERLAKNFKQNLDASPSQATIELLERIRQGHFLKEETSLGHIHDSVERVPDTAYPARIRILPSLINKTIGRQKERAQLANLVRNENRRLITIHGPGGVGKTRLAQQVAHDLAASHYGDIYFLRLANLGDGRLLIPTVAAQLDVEAADEAGLIEAIAQCLDRSPTLLVLDNYEQLLPEVTLVAKLLEMTTRLTVLVTSRERLHLYGEHEYRLNPLATDIDDGDLPVKHRAIGGIGSVREFSQLIDIEAVRLFTERAKEVQPDFTVSPANVEPIVEICQILKGLPLGIELAVAQLRYMTPKVLHSHLNDYSQRSNMLFLGERRKNIDERHHSLWHAIDWSYQLLTADEQFLFHQLGIFVGGWTQDAVESIVSRDGKPNITRQELHSLVDKSLVIVEYQMNGELRYRLLEPIREYAHWQLEQQAELTVAARSHAEYFTLYAQTAEPHLQRAEQAQWLSKLEGEQGNLRAAIRYALDNRKIEFAYTLGKSLWRYWEIRGQALESLNYLTAISEMPASQQSHLARVHVLIGLGILAEQRADFDTAVSALKESIQLAHELENDYLESLALGYLGTAYRSQGEYDSGYQANKKGLEIARKTADDWLIAHSLQLMAKILDFQGHDHQASQHLQEALPLARKNNEPETLIGILFYIGYMARHQKLFEESMQRFDEGMALTQKIGDKLFEGYLLGEMGMVNAMQDKPRQALERLRESLAVFIETGHDWGAAQTLEYLAIVFAIYQKPTEAATFAGAAEGLRARSNTSTAPRPQAEMHEAFQQLEKIGIDIKELNAMRQSHHTMMPTEAHSLSTNLSF